MNGSQSKRVLEALLLVAEKPLLLEEAREALGPASEGGPPWEIPQIRRLFEELILEYQQSQRGIRIVEVAEGFQLVTDPELAPYVARFTRKIRSIKLTRPSLETLAIVAYRQPITRVEIEQIRGVDSSGVLDTLLKVNFITIRGRKETVGRPLLYATTREFLEHFGLKSLEDLPSLEELRGGAPGPVPGTEASASGTGAPGAPATEAAAPGSEVAAGTSEPGTEAPGPGPAAPSTGAAAKGPGSVPVAVSEQEPA